MTPQRVNTVVAALALLVFSGCGGAPQAPSAYSYGDMFAEEEQMAPTADYHRGGGSGSSGRVMQEMSASPGAAMGSSDSYDMEASDDGDYEMAEAVQTAALPNAPAPMSFRQNRRSRRAARRSSPAAAPPPAPVVSASAEPAPEAPPPVEPSTAELANGAAAAAEGDHDEPADPGEPAEGEGEAPRAGPLLVYEAGLTLATNNDLSESIDEVSHMTTEMGGFLVRQDDTTIVVRVPVARFREALAAFEALGDVLNRRVSAVDVSEQVRDTRIRLQNAINMRDRLQELLERAHTVPESLTIERELERLNETIELLRGTLESLEERIAFSTITVRFQQIQEQHEVPRELFRLPFQWLDELGLQTLLQL